MSFILSFDIISVFARAAEEEWRPDPKIFVCIPAFTADAAAVDYKRIKTLLANGLTTFFISGNTVFNNGSRGLPKNSHDCIILDIWVFGNVITVDDLSTKAWQRLETCLLINNNLWGKSFSSSPIIFDDILKTISVLFSIADFNLSSCDFDSFTFKLLYCAILY